MAHAQRPCNSSLKRIRRWDFLIPKTQTIRRQSWKTTQMGKSCLRPNFHSETLTNSRLKTWPSICSNQTSLWWENCLHFRFWKWSKEHLYCSRNARTNWWQSRHKVYCLVQPLRRHTYWSLLPAPSTHYERSWQSKKHGLLLLYWTGFRKQCSWNVDNCHLWRKSINLFHPFTNNTIPKILDHERCMSRKLRCCFCPNSC